MEDLIHRIKRLNDKQIAVIILLVSWISFIPFLGSTQLFDWDEINFAEAAREMIVLNDYLRVHIDFQPFWEKPPLFFWMQAAMMQLFGVNEFSARLPNALLGGIALVTLYFAGKQIHGKRFGLLWVLAYYGSLLPNFYFKTGIIDPWFNYFMFLSVYFIWKYYSRVSDSILKTLVPAGIFCGLSVLTKGPVGYLLPSLAFFVMWIVKRKQWSFPIKEFVLFSAAMLITASTWFAIEFFKNGTWFISRFITYQIRLFTTGDAGHSGPFYYHTIVLLVGCFPATLFLFKAFIDRDKETEQLALMRQFMTVLLLVVVILFSIVKTKIVHYSSMAYFPITFLAALGIEKMLTSENPKLNWKTINSIAFWFLGSILALAFAAIPLLGLFMPSVIPFAKDEFTKLVMSADVYWSGFELSVAVVFLVGLTVAFVLLQKKQILRAVSVLFPATALGLFLLLPVVVPKLEVYLQGAPVEFYKSIQQKDVYLKVMHYKSYADLFYSQRSYENSGAAHGFTGDNWDVRWEQHLMHGELSKPAYFITKHNHAEKYRESDSLVVYKEKNGFVIFKRVK